MTFPSFTITIELVSLVLGLAIMCAYPHVNYVLAIFERRHSLTPRKVGTFGVMTLLLAPIALQASILTGPICKVYTGIFDNTFVSAIAFVIFAILLTKMMIDEGNSEKSSLLRFMVILAALFNLPGLLALVGASPC
jgi:hypothetical protein